MRSKLWASSFIEAAERHIEVPPAAIERVTRLAEQSGERIDKIIVKLGLLQEHTLASIYSDLLNRPLLKLTDFPSQHVANLDLPSRFARHNRVLPIGRDGGDLLVAMADPFDDEVIKAIEFVTGLRIVPHAAIPAELESVMDRSFGTEVSGEKTIDVDSGEIDDTDLDRLKDLASEAPVIRLVNQLITKAVEAKASASLSRNATVTAIWRGFPVLRCSLPSGNSAPVLSKPRQLARHSAF